VYLLHLHASKQYFSLLSFIIHGELECIFYIHKENPLLRFPKGMSLSGAGGLNCWYNYQGIYISWPLYLNFYV
jgi:hypothetical protein